MPLVAKIKTHDYSFEWSTPVGKWRWTTRLDVSQSNPSYSIRDIVTPYGLLRDTIPLPGEVVQAMSSSIDELKSNFAPHILLGPPTALSFELDEGRGFAPPEEVVVTNDGVYGSLLGVTLTTGASYVHVSPGQVGNLAFNEGGTFKVEVDSADLVATESPYTTSVVIQDPTATNNPVELPIEVIVRPKAVISLGSQSLLFTVAKPLSGAFPAVPRQSFVVSNTGPVGSSLEYAVKKLTGCSDWLIAFLPADGVLGHGDSDTVEVTVQPASYVLPGVYTETLRVSGYSSNSYADVEITLVIT